MALLAHKRWTGLQHGCDIGTMRHMAVGAVFSNGLVCEQERTALLCMAEEAGLSHGILLQQLRTGRAMRIVAIRTDNLAGFDRMGGYLVSISAPFLVTGIANLGLRLSLAHLVGRRMNRMATVAGQLIVLVLASFPVGACSSFVASQTLFRTYLFVCCRINTFFEYNIGSRTAFASGITLEVVLAFAVASLAVGCACIASDTVFGLVDGQDWLGLGFIMASDSSWQRVQTASLFKEL